MLAGFLDVLFGCTHKRYSFPITCKLGQRNKASIATGMYVVCLDCGKEFAYDWDHMKVLSERARTAEEAARKSAVDLKAA